MGFGIGAERIGMVIKAPRREREGGSERSEQGAGVGIGIGAERPLIELEPPPGVGGGSERSERGEGWGRADGTHMAQNESGRNAPPFCEERAKRGQRGGR